MDDLKDFIAASERIGSWLSALLEDPDTCHEFKADTEAWFIQLDKLKHKYASPEDKPYGI